MEGNIVNTVVTLGKNYNKIGIVSRSDKLKHWVLYTPIHVHVRTVKPVLNGGSPFGNGQLTA